MKPKFNLGDLVIHKLGSDTMVVCGFEEKLHDQIPARIKTGYVQCRVRLPTGFKTEVFYENELELVKDTDDGST